MPAQREDDGERGPDRLGLVGRQPHEQLLWRLVDAGIAPRYTPIECSGGADFWAPLQVQPPLAQSLRAACGSHAGWGGRRLPRFGPSYSTQAREASCRPSVPTGSDCRLRRCEIMGTPPVPPSPPGRCILPVQQLTWEVIVGLRAGGG